MSQCSVEVTKVAHLGAHEGNQSGLQGQQGSRSSRRPRLINQHHRPPSPSVSSLSKQHPHRDRARDPGLTPGTSSASTLPILDLALRPANAILPLTYLSHLSVFWHFCITPVQTITSHLRESPSGLPTAMPDPLQSPLHTVAGGLSTCNLIVSHLFLESFTGFHLLLGQR